MGNSFPITSVPKPTESRAVIYIEPNGLLGKLRVEHNENEVPFALNETVPTCVYVAAVVAIAERCNSFRGELFSFEIQQLIFS